MPDPSDDYETKARHLRRLYRQNGGERGYGLVRAEFERLFPDGDTRLDQILVSAWTEGRELAGWSYDRTSQAWFRADGSRVREEHREEWAHV